VLGCPVAYADGVLSVGEGTAFDFGAVDTRSADAYVYDTYAYPAQNVVYAYQAYSYEMMMQDAATLARLYPEIIKIGSIGKSVENRELLLLEFGRGAQKIFVCGTHHAREYIATSYLMYTIDRYAAAYRNRAMWGNYNPRAILENVTFCIVPMVNPDGVNLVQNGIYATCAPWEFANMHIYESARYGYKAWKANVRGVDVNWNYDKDWYASSNKNPRGSSGFNGDMPNTEPETRAVSAYVDQNAFEAYISFHTQGEIFYWAEDKTRPTGLDRLLKADTGFTPHYDSGTGVGGSFFDYVYRKYGKATITVELCPYVGNYPYPDYDFDRIWNPAKNILFLVGNEIIYVNSLQ